MPRNYVTDLMHFLDAEGQPVNGAGGRLARYFGMVVEAGSVMKQGEGRYIPMRCANPSRRKACASQLMAARTDRGTVEWECPSCGERGSVLNWSGTPFDLGAVRPVQVEEESRDVVVPLDELDAMRRWCCAPPSLRRLLVEAIGLGDDYLFFPAGEEELIQLREHAQLCADEARGEDRRLLDRFAARMDTHITLLPTQIEEEEELDPRLLN
ncbi:MAG TPA: hypothetical protein VJV78_43440 [Polyangiales bacterium]|nr:hypothetical protein [Polyangiales bacterium]